MGMYGKLTKRQKTILDKYNVFDVEAVDGLLKQLENIKDFESLWMDANRYLSDMKFKKGHNFMSW